MSEQNRLIYPTVDLFLYDLRDGLGQDEEKINLNRKQFWEKIYGTNLEPQWLEKLKQAEKDSADYIELLGSKKVEKFETPLNGYLYPVQLETLTRFKLTALLVTMTLILNPHLSPSAAWRK